MTIRQRALELGFSDVRFIPAFDPDEIWQQKYREYVKKGYHASMKYLENLAPRFSVKKLYQKAETIAVFSLPYIFNEHPEISGSQKSKYTVAKYALGKDYHAVIREKLDSILLEFGPGRIICDTTPLPERYFAAHSGMGFIGKNAMLIHPEKGSYFFLAFILLDRSLPPDFNQSEQTPSFSETAKPYDFQENLSRFCGSCDKCVKACPGGALDGSGLLNSRRCYSFWSIENKLDIIQAQFRKMESVFGCDICQDVCPYNAKPVTTQDSSFEISDASQNIMEGNLEDLSLKGTPYERTGLKGLRRNIEYITSQNRS